jgi:hypothetical protein
MVDAGRLRASGLHGSTREAPVEMLRGSRRSGNYQRRGIKVAEQFTGGNVGAILAVARAGVAGGELGELPGGEAKLMRGLAGAEVQRGGGSAVAQEMLHGGTSGRWFRVWGGGYEVGDKGAEGAGWFKEGSQGSRGARSGKGWRRSRL